jgi:ribulose-5-phosphate 4-epimerase/fuculose-1-phosphate aldolase
MGYRHWRRNLHSQRVCMPQECYHCRLTSVVRDIVFVAPSGVQKERIEPTHIFVLPYPQPPPSPHHDRIFLRRPKVNLKESACTPLFWNSFDLRNAGSCIHTHSQNAVMATLLWTGPTFTISHQVSWSIHHDIHVSISDVLTITFSGGNSLICLLP